MVDRSKQAALAFSLAAALVLVLAGCGGSGGSSGSTEPATPLPDTLSVSTAAVAEAGVAQAFSSSAAATPGLRFEWAFGDGGSSSEAAPSYAYPRAGDYAVSLRLSNSAGESRTATAQVSVNRLAHLQGLACSGASQTGWCRVVPPDEFKSRSVHFHDDQIAWASGDFGAIRHTRDGGRTWVAQYSGVAAPLAPIVFADDRVGWAFSALQPTLLRTTDGGTTWQQAGSLPGLAPALPGFGPAVTLRVLRGGALWVNALERAASGTRRYRNYVSQDSGITWRESARDVWDVSPGGTLWSLSERSAPFPQPGVGSGSVFRSNDLGASFQRVLDGADTGPARLIVFDDRRILVFYNGNPNAAEPADRVAFIQLTQDGGQTWTRIAPTGLAPAGLFDTFPSIGNDADWLLSLRNGVQQVSVDFGRSWSALPNLPIGCQGVGLIGNGGLICSASRPFRQWISPDRGATWVEVSPRAAEIARLQTGAFIVGDSISRDNGATWQSLFPGLQEGAETFALWAQSGLVLRRTSSRFTGLQRSTNGGREWLPGAGPEGFSKLTFVSDSVAWGMGRSNDFGAEVFEGLWGTTDGGLSWTRLSAGSGNFFAFVDERIGWRLGRGFEITTDGGQHWTPATPPGAPISCEFAAGGGLLAVFDANEGFIALDNRVNFLVRDGARTCLQRTLPGDEVPVALAKAGTQALWAVGVNGGVFLSADRGDTWRTVDTGIALPGFARWTAVHFLDARRGWLAGTDGFAAETVDGGTTWRVTRTGLSRAVRQIQFIDSRTGWMLGDDGVIAATGTGGR